MGDSGTVPDRSDETGAPGAPRRTTRMGALWRALRKLGSWFVDRVGFLGP